MKTFTQRQLQARGFTQAEDYNAESRGVASSWNGGMAGQQLPYNSVNSDRFTLGSNLDTEVFTTPAGAQNGTCQRKPSQLFAVTQTNISDFAGWSFPDGGAGLTNLLGPPSSTFDTNSSAWGPGWNKYSDVVADGVYLSVPVQAGVLKGVALVDFEFYLGDQSAYGVGSGPAGTQWRWEVGVFVDGVLTAKTGPMGCRRHTVCLPFGRPVPTRRVEVDVRWRAQYDGAGTANDYSYVSDTKLRSFQHALWVRNQYR